MNSAYNATVTARRDLSPTTMAMRVKLDNGPLVFEAGQYTVLGLSSDAQRISSAQPERRMPQSGDLIRRAYSITSKSAGPELEFAVSLVPSGALTPRLFMLQPGDRLFVEPRAHGVFTHRLASGNRDLLLCATGPAVAPYLSMIREQIPTPGHCYALVHGAGSVDELFYQAQLEELAANSPQFLYLPTLSDPAQAPGWKGLRNNIEELLRSGELEEQLGMPITPDRFDIFLSGNPSMIDEVTRDLVGRGFTSGPHSDERTNIYAERYW